MLCYAKSLQSCLTLCDPTDGSPPGSPVPGIPPGKNTGVGCHFLLQCMKVKVKSLSRVPLFTTLCTAAHQAPPSMGFFQARVLEWGAIAFSAIHINKWPQRARPMMLAVQTCALPIYPMDCSPPGFSVHGILQASVLEWGAIAFSAIKLLD